VAHFLLIHGACHGGWCWERVVAELHAAGHQVSAPDLPCDDATAGLGDYADVAVGALGDAAGDPAADIVVVGHSLGALVVPLVATRMPVRRMVMLAGIVGAPRASMADLAEIDADRDLPLRDDSGDPGIVFDDRGLFRFSPASARRVLYHDCDPADAEAAIVRLRHQRSMWAEVADFSAWPDAEIVSITCTEDRVVSPSWSDRTARDRLGVEPVQLAGGHSPFLSRPAELARLLTDGL
jgi:pimeloyl-ACP methyl ester carboxylesterase